MNVILLKGFILTSLFWLSSPWKSRQSYKNWKGKNICVTLIDWKTLSHLGERNQVGLLSSSVNEYLRCRVTTFTFYNIVSYYFLLLCAHCCHVTIGCAKRCCHVTHSTVCTHFTHTLHSTVCTQCAHFAHTAQCAHTLHTLHSVNTVQCSVHKAADRVYCGIHSADGLDSSPLCTSHYCPPTSWVPGTTQSSIQLNNPEAAPFLNVEIVTFTILPHYFWMSKVWHLA